MRFALSVSIIFLTTTTTLSVAFTPTAATPVTGTLPPQTKQQQQQQQQNRKRGAGKLLGIASASYNSGSFSKRNDDSSNTSLGGKLAVQEQQEQQAQSSSSSAIENQGKDDRNPYVKFAQRYPFVNNVLIATLKTGLADLLAQTLISGKGLHQLDVPRSLLFMMFGALYSGCFQWLYQVKIFKKLFTNVDRFTNKSWSRKLKDKAGLQSLAGQTALDLGVLTVAYLPAFYIFKASVFSGSLDPTKWLQIGWGHFSTNLGKDWFDLVRVWLPADLICFSVPLYLRMPVRHAVSFAWTAYLSFARGGH